MKISVVISVFNEERMLDACLDSLSKQVRPADEIVIVDNNCTDGSIDIAKAHGVRIVKEPKQGIWAARATGYAAARGDIVVCTDADARFPKYWLQKVEQTFEDKEVIAVTGPGVFYGAPSILNKLADVWYMKAYFFFVGLALGTKPLFGSNFAIRKVTWNKVKSSVHSNTETVFDDIDLSYHIVREGKIIYRPDMSVGISIRPLAHPVGMMRRYKKGFYSVTIHWPEQAPWNMTKHK